jgi:hypothetical protein
VERYDVALCDDVTLSEDVTSGEDVTLTDYSLSAMTSQLAMMSRQLQQRFTVLHELITIIEKRVVRDDVNLSNDVTFSYGITLSNDATFSDDVTLKR